MIEHQLLECIKPGRKVEALGLLRRAYLLVPIETSPQDDASSSPDPPPSEQQRIWDLAAEIRMRRPQ